MSQNFHASVGYCRPMWLVKANNTRTRPMLITPSSNMVDAILLYVCTLSFSMSEWYLFSLFSVLNLTWPLCCPCGAHTLAVVLSLRGSYFNVLSLWGSYSGRCVVPAGLILWPLCCPCGGSYFGRCVVPVWLILCTLMWSPLFYVYVVVLLVSSNSSMYKIK